MPGMLMDYTYKDATGNSYSGQVVADTTQPKYNYQPGASYNYGGGTYTMGATPGTPTNAPVGSVYQTTYTAKANGTAYDTYHYDPKNNAYYDVKTAGYDKMTGTYTPPGSTPVPMWSTRDGLGSEYAYIKTGDGTYHVYGGGGTAAAKITPTTVGMTTYDFKFSYTDGSYYTGTVVDDGTYGYKAGQTMLKPAGLYTITAVDAAKPPAAALAGEVYTAMYHDAKGTYATADMVPGNPEYQRAAGYGGLGTEASYVQKPAGYYYMSSSTPPTSVFPVTSVPPLT